MSDIKIQQDPVPEGAQQPLDVDNSQKSTHGFVGSQVFQGFPTGSPEVAHGTVGLYSPRPNDRPVESVNQMSVSAPVAVGVKQTDHRALEGSNAPNDFRAKGAPAVIPQMPAVRSAVGQARLNSRLDAASASVTFPPNSDNAGA
jgi:hypothetical protein